MSQDERKMLEILRFELKFLEDGGYGRSPRAPWRPTYVFEDSPTCLNFGDRSRPHPCTECALMQFVPVQHRKETVPCQFIPMTEQGETIEYLYRCGTQLEIEEALKRWLRREIGRIEAELAGSARTEQAQIAFDSPKVV